MRLRGEFALVLQFFSFFFFKTTRILVRKIKKPKKIGKQYLGERGDERRWVMYLCCRGKRIVRFSQLGSFGGLDFLKFNFDPLTYVAVGDYG